MKFTPSTGFNWCVQASGGKKFREVAYVDEEGNYYDRASAIVFINRGDAIVEKPVVEEKKKARKKRVIKPTIDEMKVRSQIMDIFNNLEEKQWLTTNEIVDLLPVKLRSARVREILLKMRKEGLMEAEFFQRGGRLRYFLPGKVVRGKEQLRQLLKANKRRKKRLNLTHTARDLNVAASTIHRWLDEIKNG
jgi:hypothetical protein